MKKAIDQAQIQPKEIDYVNAHATSTPVGDSNEAKAIFAVFGENGPFVSSTKSMTGHECWMAGASEIVYSMLMMEHSFIAPNINLENPDEDAAKLNLVRKTLDKKIDVFLSNSFGFGGTNSALLIKSERLKMNKEVIIDKINNFLIDEFEVDADDISPMANLKKTLELDSLDFVDLVVAIESNFSVKLVGEDFINVITLQDFYDLIEKKLN